MTKYCLLERTSKAMYSVFPIERDKNVLPRQVEFWILVIFRWNKESRIWYFVDTFGFYTERSGYPLFSAIVTHPKEYPLVRYRIFDRPLKGVLV